MEEQKQTKFQRFNNWHLIYLIIILVLLVVALLTHRGYQCGELVAVISFGATLSSIILSVLAIFMTFVSNESNNRLREGLHGLTEVPKNVRNAINDTIAELKEETSKMRSASQENLKTQLESNDQLQKTFEYYLSQFINAQKGNENKLSEIELALKGSCLEGYSEVDNVLSDSQISSFLRKLPKYIKMASYAIILIGQRENKAFNIDSYIKYLNFENIPGFNMLLIGYLITLRCQGLLMLDNGVIGKINRVDIVEVSDNFKNCIDNHINEILTEQEQKDVDQFVNMSANANTSGS